MTTNAAADSILDRLDTAIKNKTPDWRGLAQEFCDGEWGESENISKICPTDTTIPLLLQNG